MIHPALLGLIDRYRPQTSIDHQNAVREIAREIALLGLWRTPFYDLIWYVGRRVPLNLAHLEARMRQSGDWQLEQPLDALGLRERLEERFASTRFDQAKEDIEPFLKDHRELSLWSHGFFMDLIPLIQIGGR
jgi:hypothetical protein